MSKTKLEEINRNIYDIKNKDEYDILIKKGINYVCFLLCVLR